MEGWTMSRGPTRMRLCRELIVFTLAAGLWPATGLAANPQAPANTALPIVTGTSVQADSLMTSDGSWTNSPTTFTYAWRRCDTSGFHCVAVDGATSSSYVLQALDVGHTMRSRITAYNASGSQWARSAPTAVVTAASSGGGGGVLGGDQAVEPYADQNGGGIPQAWRIDNMSAGTAGSISFYVDRGNAATGMSVGLYSNSNGHPSRLLAQGTVSSLTGGAWNRVTLGTQPTLTAGTYWLAAVGTGGALGFDDRLSGSCDTEVSGMQSLTSLQGTWSQGQ